MFLACISCNNSKKTKKKSGKKIISVSIIPQKYFIEQIAGDDFQINVLVPPSESPATYEPLPNQMKDMLNSSAYFLIGHIPFEHAWIKNILSNNKEIKVFDNSEGVKLIRGEAIQHGDHMHPGGIDPHIWVSPKTCRKLAHNIYKALIKLNPSGLNRYNENLQKFITKIDNLSTQLSAVSLRKNISFMIYHPALSYLARDYNFEQIPIEADGKEPSAKYVKDICDIAKDRNIQYIFIQKQFNRESAMAIAKEIGAEIKQINPLGENWEQEIKKIITYLKDLK
jgi:zinc transport system substrate-binding protein